MHGVEAEQVGIGLDRAEIVDADDFDVLANHALLRESAENQTANAAETIDCDFSCHSSFVSVVSVLGQPTNSRRAW